MSLWSKIKGTIETVWQIGLGGPLFKSTGGVIEARNSADSAYAIVRGGTPSGNSDLVTKLYADGLAGGGHNGTATIDFGAFPGSAEASVAVTGQTGILATSKVQAWLSLETDTSDHTADEHRIENMRISAGTIVVGTGFTIYAEVWNPTGNYEIPDGNRVYGQWTVNWTWV